MTQMLIGYSYLSNQVLFTHHSVMKRNIITLFYTSILLISGYLHPLCISQDTCNLLPFIPGHLLHTVPERLVASGVVRSTLDLESGQESRPGTGLCSGQARDQFCHLVLIISRGCIMLVSTKPVVDIWRIMSIIQYNTSVFM